MGNDKKTSGKECARCGRQLKDPVSIARGIGPKCWRLSGGGVFDKDLDVGDLEWARREKLLQDGGEIDLGTNWRYMAGDKEMTMRVSIRYRDGMYEAYGCLLSDLSPDQERIFATGTDLKLVYEQAVAAGPMCTAMTYRAAKRKVV